MFSPITEIGQPNIGGIIKSTIFDMPPKSDKDDLKGIPSPIKEHLEACKRGLSAYPSRVNEALDHAQRASKLVMDIERRVRFYKAECYRRLRMWEQAYGLYERCNVVTEDDEKWLLRMRILCRAEIERLRRDNAEIPNPQKNSRPSHQEDRGKVKEYRGKKKRVSWR